MEKNDLLPLLALIIASILPLNKLLSLFIERIKNKAKKENEVQRLQEEILHLHQMIKEINKRLIEIECHRNKPTKI